jgi:hypothetical protein
LAERHQCHTWLCMTSPSRSTLTRAVQPYLFSSAKRRLQRSAPAPPRWGCRYTWSSPCGRGSPCGTVTHRLRPQPTGSEDPPGPAAALSALPCIRPPFGASANPCAPALLPRLHDGIGLTRRWSDTRATGSGGDNSVAQHHSAIGAYVGMPGFAQPTQVRWNGTDDDDDPLERGSNENSRGSPISSRAKSPCCGFNT